MRSRTGDLPQAPGPDDLQRGHPLRAITSTPAPIALVFANLQWDRWQPGPAQLCPPAEL